MSTRETALVRVALADVDETLLGVQLLVSATCPMRGPFTVAGGVSDVLPDTQGNWCVLWIGGVRVVAGTDAVIVAEAPPQT